MTGYNRLKQLEWKEEQLEKIDKYFSGAASDWKKKTLSEVRTQLKLELLKAQRQRCAYCRRIIFDEIGKIEIDHIIPKNEHPNFTYWRINLAATCKRCNHQKGEHNPLRRKLKKLVNYPNLEKSYIWIHPYLHDYRKHIKIDKNGFFHSNQNSREGSAVISACGLASMHNAIANNRRALAIAAKSFSNAVMTLIFQYPDASSSLLAVDLQKRTGKKVPLVYLEDEIEKYRAASFSLLKKQRSNAASGPYAKYLK